MELGDFALGFAEGCWAGKGLCHGFAADFADEAKLRIVAWIVGFGAMAVRFSAPADHRAQARLRLQGRQPGYGRLAILDDDFAAKADCTEVRPRSCRRT